MGKTLLGIGYILMAIVYFIGIILVAIGWYTLGKDRDKELWKVIGILGIPAFISALAVIAVAAPMIFAVMAHGPEAVAHALAADVGALIAAVIAIIFLAIFSILQSVCLWQFGNEYNSSLTKVAAIIYIIVGATLILILLIGAMLGPIGVGILLLLLLFIAGILAGIGILTAKEQAPTTATTTTTETPPPPPL